MDELHGLVRSLGERFCLLQLKCDWLSGAMPLRERGPMSALVRAHRKSVSMTSVPATRDFRVANRRNSFRCAVEGRPAATHTYEIALNRVLRAGTATTHCGTSGGAERRCRAPHRGAVHRAALPPVVACFGARATAAVGGRGVLVIAAGDQEKSRCDHDNPRYCRQFHGYQACAGLYPASKFSHPDRSTHRISP
jgi:hypothetical protein